MILGRNFEFAVSVKSTEPAGSLAADAVRLTRAVKPYLSVLDLQDNPLALRAQDSDVFALSTDRQAKMISRRIR